MIAKTAITPSLLIQPELANEPIKSYLYVAKPPSLKNINQNNKPDKLIPTPEKVNFEQLKPVNQHISVLPHGYKNQNPSDSDQPNNINTSTDALLTEKDMTEDLVSASKILSPWQHLAQLQAEIKQQGYQQHYQDKRQNKNSVQSVFNPSPTLVPHSTKNVSNDEVLTANTTAYSIDMAIVKNNDGSCSIKQDLSNVGIEGITTVQYFKCGESDFDKAFRIHMKKNSKKANY
ncbi:MAG: hypothetical protein ACSHW0_08110 [Thalassotalea sp.]